MPGRWKPQRSLFEAEVWPHRIGSAVEHLDVKVVQATGDTAFRGGGRRAPARISVADSLRGGNRPDAGQGSSCAGRW